MPFRRDSLANTWANHLVFPTVFAMTIRIAALLISGCLAAAPRSGLGQDGGVGPSGLNRVDLGPESVGQETRDFPDASLTREQWQQRIEAARRRSEEFVANTRAQTVPPQLDPKDTEAAERAMNDPLLREGDIVATGKGFVVFIGRDETHQSQDFRSATPSQRSPPP